MKARSQLASTIGVRSPMSLAELLGIPGILLLVYVLTPVRTSLLIGVVVSAVTVVGAIPIAIHRVASVRTSPRPAQDAVQALVLFTSLVIVGFSTLYFALAVHGDDQIVNLQTKIDALYFTVTIMATVGFGDVAATGQMARLIVTLNIVFNLIALGGVIKLMSWAARQRIDERQRDSGPST